MVMGAPANGWGMIGIWPHLKIVSVRATPAGQEGFEFDSYSRALEECRLRAARRGIAVAELAVGGQRRPTAEEKNQLLNVVAHARAAGLSVVAAGGNSGGEVEAPASFEPIFAVAAGNASGALCDIASRGSSIDLVAPGCGLDQALPSTGSPALGTGSSQASSVVGAVLAALRAYAPELTVTAAEALIRSSARMSPGGLVIDAGNAFRAAGLSSLVKPQAGDPVEQPPPPSSDVSTPLGMPAFQSPRLAWIRFKSGLLRLAVRTRPRGAVMVVSVRRRGVRRTSLRVYERRSRSLAVHVRRWFSVEISFQDAYGSRPASPALRVDYPIKRSNG